MSAPETGQKDLKGAKDRQKGLGNERNRDIESPDSTI